MSSNITGSNTMSTSAPVKTTKRVAKKTDASTSEVVSTPSVATPVPVATATTAAVVAPTKVSKKAAATTTTTATTSSVPVATTAVAVTTVTAPEAQAVQPTTEQAVVHVPVSEEIDTLIRRTTEQRDAAAEQLRALQRLQKHVARELKEASKRRRNKRKVEEGENVVKRPTIFTTPVPLKDELAALLGKSKGTQMTPAEVTKAVRTYIDTHNLKDKENGHMIHPDANMRRVLGVTEGEVLTYRNIQKFLYKLYDLKKEKKPVATA